MSQPRLRAKFFVTPDGLVIPKARPLLRSIAFKLFNSSDKKCAICRKPLTFWAPRLKLSSPFSGAHIDHIIPRSKGGQNNKENLRILCLSCNCSKGAKI